MHALRLARGSRAFTNSLRSFTTTSQCHKSPSLADISGSPQDLSSFDAKQKEFREKLAAQARAKDAGQSSSTFPASTRTAPDASNASSPSDPMALGSLSSATAARSQGEDGKSKGKLSSLLYGTKEGRAMDQEIEKSFSEVLARGKYVHSIVFHEVKPDKVDEYVELVGSWYPKMASMPENKVHLVGSWRTEVGDCDTFGKSIFDVHFAC